VAERVESTSEQNCFCSRGTRRATSCSDVKSRGDNVAIREGTDGAQDERAGFVTAPDNVHSKFIKILLWWKRGRVVEGAALEKRYT
jgi:hypothetical protein